MLEILTIFHDMKMFGIFKFFALLNIGLTGTNLIVGVTDNYFHLIFDTILRF